MSYIAAIDIGSNAIRLAIANQRPDGLHLTYRSREPVRLGSSVFGTGEIDEAIYEDLKSALLQFKNQMENHNVLKYRAIATSAMREAKNSAEVVKALAASTGLKVEIISGEEEARLVSKAISQKVNLDDGNYLLIDIGGGSIELVAMVKGEMLKKESFVLGMVRILELQKDHSDPLERWFPTYIEDQLNGFFKDLPPLITAVGTGGNMDRFIKLKSFVADTEEGIDLSKDQMQKVQQLLSEISYKERIKKFGLKPDRADVIIPAAIATNKFMELGACRSILFPQVGVKDGVLQELSSSEAN